MHLDSVGQVLATRTLDVEEQDCSRPVTVLIGAPRRSPETKDFCCPYQILGLGDGTVRYAEGVDEAQAIYIAMEAVGTLLSATEEARTGRLTWYGEPAHGFPVRDQRPQLQLVASS